MTKDEIKQTKNEIATCFQKQEIKQVNYIPINEQIPKGNKAYNLDCSVMFVDIRNSTFLTDEINKKNMMKVYKALSRIVANSVEKYFGEVKQIIGDGYMAIFIKKENKKSAELAYSCALEINTLIHECLKPLLSENNISDVEIKVGIGINSGDILMTRVGRRKKNKYPAPVFPSRVTNYASKYCNEAEPQELIIGKSTFDELSKKIQDTFEEKNLFNEVCYYKQNARLEVE